MMRRTLISFVAGAFVLSGAAVAQTTQSAAPGTGTTTMEKTETRTEKGPGTHVKTKTVTVIGTVKEYEAGKSIKIDTRGKTKSFDLNAKDTTATVDPSVAVGSMVKLTDKKDDAGNHAISVEPHTAKTSKHHKASTKSATSTTSSTSKTP